MGFAGPKIADFPSPPSGRTGWPWTEMAPEVPADGPWPRISIITPSFNQAAFLEETIRSVLLQGYPNLEYIVIDGGSTDGCVEILKKYSEYLAYWVSEKDRGQSNALNKGFARATGDLIGWQNSDDFYAPGAFAAAARASLDLPGWSVLYGPAFLCDEQSKPIRAFPVGPFDIHNLIPYANMCNQAMFFSRRVFEDGQFIDESYRHAMDQEYLLRLAIRGHHFHYVAGLEGCFRLHSSAKTHRQQEICMRECAQIYTALYKNPQLPTSLRRKALESLQQLCRYQFGMGHLSLFKETYDVLRGLEGPKTLTLSLLLRYLLYRSGPGRIKMAQRLKHLLIPS